MRLNDADEIDFNKAFGGKSGFAKDMRKAAQMLVDKQSTAFDVEKVIEKLQALSDKADDDIAVCEADTCQYYDGYGDGLDRAIEIVKQGGRDEQINT